MKPALFCLLCVVLSLSVGPLLAQDAPLPTPEPIELAAGDGLMLMGDLYRPATLPEGGAPALLLMHQYDSNRISYNPVIPQFLDAGYIVLTVDLRGHGQSGKKRDWVKAQDDTQLWLAWLRDQEGVNGDKIAIIGASIGSNLALVGCAQDERCVTVVALSPGLNYFGVEPTDAVVEGLQKRSALLIAGRRDKESADALRSLFTLSTGKLAAELLPTGTHGIALFSTPQSRQDTMALILTWLAQEFASVKAK